MRVSPLICAIATAVLVLGCSGQKGIYESAKQMTGGDPAAGKAAIRKYGCNACHTIPGVQGAYAVVGPPLDHMRVRIYVAGRVTNTAPNLISWIRNPKQIDDRTAMPNMGVTEKDARDIAAYLYTLK